ncbi:acetate uptake transporter family protein [Spirillospora sp. CA-142024]|uniref:acetate uptake transporter family protein n=1 Tax=Spirillospora sp. CA-142024 TaxID=3240036 RepID=UPI003D907680
MARRREHAASPSSGEHTGSAMGGQGAAMPAEGAATAVPGRGDGGTAEHALWEDRTRVFLQPIAAPSILGLFGLAGAAMMVGAWQADWYGGVGTPLILWPFVLTFGGIAQFLAGMWAYRARDGLATVMHGMWGAFWIGWGLFFMLVSIGAVPLALVPTLGTLREGYAFWFVALAAITAIGALAALGESMALSLMLLCLAGAAGFTSGGFFSPSDWALKTGGWLFVVAAVLCLYIAAALMFQNSFGRTILPLLKTRRGAAAAGGRATWPLEYPMGEPGVKIGQ